MEDLILRALDLGGTLTLSVVILMVGGKKLDKIDLNLNKLLQLTALGFSSDGKKNEVKKILDGK